MWEMNYRCAGMFSIKLLKLLGAKPAMDGKEALLN